MDEANLFEEWSPPELRLPSPQLAYNDAAAVGPATSEHPQVELRAKQYRQRREMLLRIGPDDVVHQSQPHGHDIKGPHQPGGTPASRAPPQVLGQRSAISPAAAAAQSSTRRMPAQSAAPPVRRSLRLLAQELDAADTRQSAQDETQCPEDTGKRVLRQYAS